MAGDPEWCFSGMGRSRLCFYMSPAAPAGHGLLSGFEVNLGWELATPLYLREAPGLKLPILHHTMGSASPREHVLNEGFNSLRLWGIMLGSPIPSAAPWSGNWRLEARGGGTQFPPG